MARQVYITNEKTTPIYKFTLVDESGNSVSTITSLTLTYYNVADGVIINSRSAQDINNLNNGTFVFGEVTWNLTVADTAIINTSLGVNEKERHRAIFTWVYTAAGAIVKTGRDEIDILIDNLDKVT